MNQGINHPLNTYYQQLGLDPSADLAAIKTAYRRLARRYHPDTCPPQPEQAAQKFIELTHAYEQLCQWLTAPPTPHSRPIVPSSPRRQQQDHQLKVQTYKQLQNLLATERFARAIALIEGLAVRLPQDVEVRQWQAIAYFQWGKALVDHRQWGKAKVYLRKAIRTDPHNLELFQAVEQQLQRLHQRISL